MKQHAQIDSAYRFTGASAVDDCRIKVLLPSEIRRRRRDTETLRPLVSVAAVTRRDRSQSQRRRERAGCAPPTSSRGRTPRDSAPASAGCSAAT